MKLLLAALLALCCGAALCAPHAKQRFPQSPFMREKDVAKQTALDKYVHAPDPAYKWSLNSTFKGDLGYTAYILKMTSQTWLKPT